MSIVTAADLLAVPDGSITEQGLRTNIRVGVQYIDAWLGGLGCVPLYNLMEDAATAEISRAQVWQWIRHPRGVLDDGRKVTVELYRQMLEEEMGELRAGKGQMRFEPEHLEAAREIFDHLDQRRVRRFPDAASLWASALADIISAGSGAIGQPVA